MNFALDDSSDEDYEFQGNESGSESDEDDEEEQKNQYWYQKDTPVNRYLKDFYVMLLSL
jgi:hypothetical protein